MAEYTLAYLLFSAVGPLLEKQKQRIWDRTLP